LKFFKYANEIAFENLFDKIIYQFKFKKVMKSFICNLSRNLTFFREIKYEKNLTKDEKLKQIEIIKQLLRENGTYVIPNSLTQAQLEILLETDSPVFMEKYLKEFSNEYVENKRLQDQLSYLDPYESNATLFDPKKLIKYFNNNVAASIRCQAPKIVLDFQFESSCNNRISYVADLMKSADEAYKINARDKEPFQMVFCNLKKNSKFYQWLDNNYNFNSSYLVEFTERNYTDIFSKDKLIYLTADANREMVSYDPNRVYVLGVTRDFRHVIPHSFHAARRDGIEYMRFPCERFVKWDKSVPKSLKLVTCLNILLSIKSGRSWNETFNKFNVGVLNNKKSMQ
jgi:hypothetical protein